LITLTILAGGCVTDPNHDLFQTDAGPWHIRQGQFIWKPAGHHPELAGEFVLAESPDGRNSIEVTKTLLPVIRAQRTRDQWYIRFSTPALGFRGQGSPPRRFLWLYLPEALAGDNLPAPLAFSRHPDGGWRIANSDTGEWIDGYLEL
jgi:hypothetical protein